MSCLALGGCASAGTPGTAAVAMSALHLRSPAPWKQGLGPLDDVEAGLRVAFSDAQGHELLPPPGPRTWRRLRPEAPQSVADFRAEGPNSCVAPRDRIALLPLGQFPFEVVADEGFVGMVRTPELTAIAAVLAAFFATPVDTLRVEAFPAARIPRRIRDGRAQYDARALLDRAAVRLPKNAHSMLALVNVDLFVLSEQAYAYGWSTLHNRLGVIGFSRLEPGAHGELAPEDAPGALLRRGLRVAVHEVGHMFGLGHCQVFRCAMNGIADLADLDATPLRLCPLCLRKLHIVTGLDPRARDAALLAVFTELGITEEARWVAERAHGLWRTDPMLASGPP
jgi:archaemetzincin